MKILDPGTARVLGEVVTDAGYYPVWAVPSDNAAGYTFPRNSTGGYEAPVVHEMPPQVVGVGLRPGDDVILLDPDQYDGKFGADQLAALEAELGELPATWKLTARGPGDRGGRYMYFTGGTWGGQALPVTAFMDIDVISRWHKFSWSLGHEHFKTGTSVCLYDPDGSLALALPPPSALPELPQAWAEFLTRGRADLALASGVPVPSPDYGRPECPAARSWLAGWQRETGDGTLAGFVTEAGGLNLAGGQVRGEREYKALVYLKTLAIHGHNAGQAVAEACALYPQLAETVRVRWDSALGHRTDDLTCCKYAELKQQLVTEPVAQFNQQAAQAAASTVALPPESATSALSVRDQFRMLPEYTEMLFNQAMKEVVAVDAVRALQVKFSGYEKVDLSQPLPEPAKMRFLGSGPLIPPGTVTILYGARASGKTWASAVTAAQEMRAGSHVFWIDFERQPLGLASKLKALGTGQHVIDAQLHYAGGAAPPVDKLREAVASQPGSPLVVVDAFRGLQATLAPLSSANDGDAVEQVYIDYLNPLCEAGATVLVLDHIAKNKGDGRVTVFGSERKESAADYVVQAEQVLVFSRDHSGYAKLTVTKDRYGRVPAGTVAGALWMPAEGTGRRTPELEGKSADEVFSIREYPDVPELRSWTPEGDPAHLADASSAQGAGLAARSQRKTARQAAYLDLVSQNPLRYTSLSAARTVVSLDPELFGDAGNPEDAAHQFARRMVADGLLRQDGSKKLEVAQHTIVKAPAPGTKVDPSVFADGDTTDEETNV